MSLLEKLVEVRFWLGMGLDRSGVAKMVGFCSPSVVDNAAYLLEYWGGDEWDDIPVRLGGKSG